MRFFKLNKNSSDNIQHEIDELLALREDYILNEIAIKHKLKEIDEKVEYYQNKLSGKATDVTPYKAVIANGVEPEVKATGFDVDPTTA